MIDALLAQYKAAHFRSLDDSARQHLHQFGTFVKDQAREERSAAEGLADRLSMAAEFLAAHGYGVTPPAELKAPEPDAPAVEVVMQQQSDIARFERRTYADGSTATGLAPLPAFMDKTDAYPEGVPTVAVEPLHGAPEGFVEPNPEEPCEPTGPSEGSSNASGGGSGEEDPPPKP